MAAKKPAKSETGINYTQGNNLFARLDVAKAKVLFERMFPQTNGGKPREFGPNGPGAFVTNCILPGHIDDDPSLVIDCKRGFAQCYGVGCMYHTKNLLKLLQDATQFTYKEVVNQIHTATGARVVTGKAEKELSDLDDHQLATITIFQACNDHMWRCLHPPKEGPYLRDYSPVFLQVVQRTLDWFYKERGRNPDFVRRLPYGLLPSEELRQKFCADILQAKADAEAARGNITITKERRAKILERIEAMFKDVDASWVHCITFHTGYGLTTPGRLRLRKPMNDKTGQGGTKTLPGFREDDPVGFFGLYLPDFRTFTLSEVSQMIVLVVEGEHDALGYLEGLLSEGKTGVRALGAIGTHNETALDVLWDAGIEKVYLFGDEPSPDHGKGEGWVKFVLGTASRVDARVFVGWHELREGAPKDPDEAIHQYGFSHVYNLTVGPNAMFQTSEKWAVQRVLEHTASINEDETREKMRWAIEYGTCLKNPTSFASYLSNVAVALKIPPGPLRQEITKVSYTEAGYVARLADVLDGEFHRVCRHEGAKSAGEIELYHRRTRKSLRFFMTDGRGMMAQLATVFGDMMTFFKDYVGLPPTLDDSNLEDVQTSMLLPDKLALLQRYLEISMQALYQGVPSRRECQDVGQGVRYVPDYAKPGTNVLYVINGDRVYKGRWRPGCETACIDWEELTGPSDGPYLFLIDPTKKWTDNINSVDDLMAGNEYTKDSLLQVAKNIESMFRSLWVFKYQDTDPTFLAYHVLGLAGTAAFKTKSVVHVQGESQAGKSSILSVFGGTKFPGLRLVESAIYKATYSAAHVMQTWNAVTLAMILDEFEAEAASRSHKGMQVENISEMIREITTEYGASPGRGTQDGQAKNMNLHTDVILGSILRAGLPQDNNRRMSVEIYKNKTPGAMSPDIAVPELFGAQYAAMKRTLTLGLFKFIPELEKKAETIRADIAHTSRADYQVPARFSDNLLQCATVMDLLGQNWGAFLTEVFAARKAGVMEMTEDTAASSLFSRIVSSPNVNLGPGMKGSVAQLVSKSDQVTFLNNACSGAFFDERQKLLIIDWYVVTSVNGLLHRVPEYDGMSPSGLKHVLDQHPTAVRSNQYGPLSVVPFLRNLGHGGNERAISVIDVSVFVEQMRAGSNTHQDIPPKTEEKKADVIPITRKKEVDNI